MEHREIAAGAELSARCPGQPRSGVCGSDNALSDGCDSMCYVVRNEDVDVVNIYRQANDNSSVEVCEL